jgi:DNA polymerase
MKDQVHYMHVDGMTNKWVETHTYGGKLAENITQAISRDILAEAMTRAGNMEIVLHVHDEIVIEVGADTQYPDTLDITQCMEQIPAWAAGFPIKVEAWRGVRYRK